MRPPDNTSSNELEVRWLRISGRRQDLGEWAGPSFPWPVLANGEMMRRSSLCVEAPQGLRNSHTRLAGIGVRSLLPRAVDGVLAFVEIGRDVNGGTFSCER